MEGKEQADAWARAAASQDDGRAGRISLSFVRRRGMEEATQQWRRDIEARNQGRRVIRLPTPASRLGIRP